MTREEAIEVLSGFKTVGMRNGKTQLYQALYLAISALREQESLAEKQATSDKKTSEWFSVEDRLPEKNQDVLCWYEYFRFGDYNRMYRTYGIGYCINGYWGGEVANGHRCKVLAWMPLPEPPEV